MMRRLLTYLKYGDRFCGIEHTTKNGKEIIYASQLKRSKKQLLVDDFTEEDTVEDIAEKLPKSQSVFLIINNDKVITKTIDSEQNDALKLIYKSFPNINLDDFYFDILSQETTHFIALCRKDYINNLINTYAKQKLSITNFSLGNSLIGSIAGFVNHDEIYSSNSKITLKNNLVKHIEKIDIFPQIYNINGLDIPNQQLLSFSGALQTVLNTNPTKSNISEKKVILEDDFKQARFFNLFTKFGGLFILVLLLINFFFFNHYYTKVEEYGQMAQINQSTKSQILKLDKTVSKKQKMVDDLLKSNGSRSAFYMNNITHSLPHSILLTRLNYQPLVKRIKVDQIIELKENTINISGKSSNSEVFSKWISDLEQKDWIESTSIVDYGATSTTATEFKIQIILSDE